MTDPESLAKAIKSASEVASSPFFRTIIDKMTGFTISKWAAEGELRKKMIHDEYEMAKESGIRGMQYIEYMRSTENLINTAVKSAKYIDQNKPNEIKMDNDFFWNTIEHAKTVSNDDIQELIAKIIASEYNKPGSYSMSTLQTLKMVGKTELEQFEMICSLCIYDNLIPAIVFDGGAFNLGVFKKGISYEVLLDLQNLGLILTNNMVHRLSISKADDIIVSYFDKKLIFQTNNENEFETYLPDFYKVSLQGREILKHLNPEFSVEYYKWLTENLNINHYKFIACT